jgi:hypothetical protein
VMLTCADATNDMVRMAKANSRVRMVRVIGMHFPRARGPSLTRCCRDCCGLRGRIGKPYGIDQYWIDQYWIDQIYGLTVTPTLTAHALISF